MEYSKLMQLAIDIAKKANPSPNPRVGCIIIKNKKIIAEGIHKTFGGSHAEVNALRMAGENANGATMIVSLEPCSHYGKTPPCVKAIIKSGVKKIVIGVQELNKATSGGMAKLKRAGIKVILLDDNEAKKLIKYWRHW